MEALAAYLRDLAGDSLRLELSLRRVQSLPTAAANAHTKSPHLPIRVGSILLSILWLLLYYSVILRERAALEDDLAHFAYFYLFN